MILNNRNATHRHTAFPRGRSVEVNENITINLLRRRSRERERLYALVLTNLFVCLFVCLSVAKMTRFSQKVSNLEQLSPPKKPHKGFLKNPSLDP